MREKLQEVLDTVQRTAVFAADSAAGAVRGVTDKAAQMVSAARQERQAAALREEIASLLQEVGAMIYGTHTGTPTESEVLLGKLKEIDEVYAKLDALRGDSCVRNGQRYCMKCGTPAGEKDVFCKECGARL